MDNYFEKQFELRHFEMNKFGEASPTTILTLLEETAADHCNLINYSLYDLLKQKIGWVLVSGVMQMERYPRYKEKIIIRTWLSKYSIIKGFRENFIFDEQRNIIGRAKGLWVFFDIERRRPLRIFKEIKERWQYFNEECIDYDVTREKDTVNSSELVKEFNVNHFDTDMNLHVSNLRYLQWAMESIPDYIIDNYYLHTIDGRFVEEAHFGDIVISLTQKHTKDISFSHTVKTKRNNTTCVKAKTFWEKR